MIKINNSASIVKIYVYINMAYCNAAKKFSIEFF